ncbi:MAG TPA: MMPL family transporter [Gaiellaceae bacterium]|nr:MMPL family transporter [Gaiellaceae bacterium]
MKSRVIQDGHEPEPEPRHTASDLCSKQMQRAMNIAGRMGAWSAGHWKTAVFGWLAAVVVSFYVGNTLFGLKQLDQYDAGAGQSHKADQILKKAFPERAPQTEFVLVQSKDRMVDDPAFRATVNDVVGSVKTSTAIKGLTSPYDRGHDDLISDDRRAAMVKWDMKGDADEAQDKVDALSAASEQVATRHPDFYVGHAGVSSEKALDKLFTDQLALAGERSIPITIGVLLLVLGTLVAVGIPIVLALTGVVGTIGLVALTSHAVPADQNVNAVILLIGLAVGVDYSLFYIKRWREERAAGRNSSAALAVAASTSGRSVLISGFTVMIAMAGMFLAGDKTYLSFAIATMIVVAVAMLGSLTVLPAILAKLGPRVDKGRIPFVHRIRHDAEGSRVWKAILRPTLRHPAAAVVLAGGALLLLALPAFRMHTAQSGFDALPKNAPTVGTINRVQDAFSNGDVAPAIVAVKADTDAPATQQALSELQREALASGQAREPIEVETNAAHNVARVTIPLVGKGVDSKSNAALDTLRSEILPQTLGKLPDDTTWAVTGITAQSVDQNSLLKRKAPIVFGFVLIFAFLLLLVAFRSIVIALKAIVLNLLSVGAAYGVLVLIFQYGWGESLLDFNSNGGIAFWLPIFLFVILFGLSMDYHVFILSRVREAYDRGASTEEAVEHGITTTAGVVTSAAIVMVGVFFVFALMPILDMKEMGIGLAAAVLIDATIVRAVLLPASMKLLGDWNWYLPKWLEWLPRLETDPTPDGRTERVEAPPVPAS